MSMTISANKGQLITALRANRDVHVSEYQEAMHGWRSRVAEELEATVQKARNGKLTTMPFFNLREPQTYQKDYDCAIAMLEMHTADDIEVTTTDFQHFVQDDWDWKDQFSTLNSSYTSRR